MIKKTIILLTAATLTIGLAPGAQAKEITKLAVTAIGANHVGGTGAMNGSAKGTFILNLKKSSLCANVKTKDLTDVKAAHIHKGAKGVDGPPFITFDILKFNSTSQNCVNVDKALLSDISKSPSMYYFNVHTKDYFAGAVRGQLGKKK
ncbi:MAG: CHRD domain-containing protein [Candidatus Planktophila sp.]|nr:CHRD domain-containing protein [Candidatus Planktophila sp.]